MISVEKYGFSLQNGKSFCVFLKRRVLRYIFIHFLNYSTKVQHEAQYLLFVRKSVKNCRCYRIPFFKFCSFSKEKRRYISKYTPVFSCFKQFLESSTFLLILFYMKGQNEKTDSHSTCSF